MKGITSERSSLMGRAVLSFTLIVRVQFKQLCRDGILTLNQISFSAAGGLTLRTLLSCLPTSSQRAYKPNPCYQ